METVRFPLLKNSPQRRRVQGPFSQRRARLYSLRSLICKAVTHYTDAVVTPKGLVPPRTDAAASLHPPGSLTLPPPDEQSGHEGTNGERRGNQHTTFVLGMIVGVEHFDHISVFQ